MCVVPRHRTSTMCPCGIGTAWESVNVSVRMHEVHVSKSCVSKSLAQCHVDESLAFLKVKVCGGQQSYVYNHISHERGSSSERSFFLDTPGHTSSDGAFHWHFITGSNCRKGRCAHVEHPTVALGSRLANQKRACESILYTIRLRLTVIREKAKRNNVIKNKKAQGAHSHTPSARSAARREPSGLPSGSTAIGMVDRAQVFTIDTVLQVNQPVHLMQSVHCELITS